MYELDWVKEKASDFLHNAKVEDEFEAIILGIDISGQNKISLSRKQLLENHWRNFMEKHKPNDVVEGVVKRVESFRMLVSLEGWIADVVHVENVSWAMSEDTLRKFKEEDMLQVFYLSGQFDDKQSKISLGIKQMRLSPFVDKYKEQLRTNVIIMGVVSSIDPNGIEVTIFDANQDLH